MELVDLLRYMHRQRMTLLMLTAKMPPTFQRDGQTFESSEWKGEIGANECRRLIYSVLYPEQRAELEREGQHSSLFRVKGLGQYRIDAARLEDSISATITLAGTAD